ncbi:MAG: MipA/OmpV family protein [Rhodoferax sp.]|uniref:MipA/OmpV family protein n=1 Tax=Rhodoferax sp. TaxID=50421 RepID=UPI0032650839
MCTPLFRGYAGLLLASTVWAATGNSALAQDAPNLSDSWKFSAGLGLISQPKYPGSGDSKTSVLPILGANYGRYFIGGVPGAGVPAGIGAYLVQDAHWRLGVGLGGNLDKPRKESDSPRLAGLGDIDATALGTVFASYSDAWWKVGGNVLTDIGGKNQGTRVSVDFEARYSPMPKLMLTAGPGLTWADGKYTQTFFGVDAAQSARSGLARYTAKAGLNTVSFNLGANYQLTQQWGLGARFTASSLRGDAADSPVTEEKSQNSFGVFANYRF